MVIGYSLLAVGYSIAMQLPGSRELRLATPYYPYVVSKFPSFPVRAGAYMIMGRMKPDIERNLGEQPIRQVMVEHDLKARDLVATSTAHLTHKMVARACKGRRLTPNTKRKVRSALNGATGKEYPMSELFTY